MSEQTSKNEGTNNAEDATKDQQSAQPADSTASADDTDADSFADGAQASEAQASDAQASDAQQSGESPDPAVPAAAESDVPGGEGADQEGELDELFLSPDDDSEDVVDFDDTTEADDEVVDDQAEQWNQQIADLEEQRDDFKQRWVRTTADLENLRKRAKREKQEFRKYGHDKVALELIPAVDNLERALAHAGEGDDDESGVIDGVKMVYRQIMSALEKHGVSSFESEGSAFDPEKHEAIQQVETSEQDTGTVLEQFQKGYFIHDRLLRPAMVSVAKRVSDPDNEQAPAGSDSDMSSGD